MVKAQEEMLKKEPKTIDENNYISNNNGTEIQLSKK